MRGNKNDHVAGFIPLIVRLPSRYPAAMRKSRAARPEPTRIYDLRVKITATGARHFAWAIFNDVSGIMVKQSPDRFQTQQGAWEAGMAVRNNLMLGSKMPDA